MVGTAKRAGPPRVLLVVRLALGAAAPLVEPGRQVAGTAEAGALLRTPGWGQVTGPGGWDVATEKEAAVLRQYVGSAQAPFFEFLARER